MKLLESIEANPYQYDLFATLRYLEAKYSENPRIGESLKPSEENFVFRQEASMAFATSTVSKYLPATEPEGPFDKGSKEQIFNLAFGMFGPNGALPLHLTEYAFSREHNYGDKTLSRFADIFHHRMISLFYRAAANVEPTSEMDRLEQNRFDLYSGGLSGLYYDSQTNIDDNATPDKKKHRHKERWKSLHRTGLFSLPTRPADGLKGLISDFLKAKVEIKQLTGGWLKLARENQFQISVFGENNQLGVNTVLGEEVFDVQHKFTISIGPLSHSEFRELLPNTALFQEMRELTRLYCSDEYDWDIELILDEEQAPLFQLGQKGELGWSSWLGEPNTTPNQSVLLESKGF